MNDTTVAKSDGDEGGNLYTALAKSFYLSYKFRIYKLLDIEDVSYGVFISP